MALYTIFLLLYTQVIHNRLTSSLYRYRFKHQDEVRLLTLQDNSCESSQEDMVDFLLQCLHTKVPTLKELCRVVIRAGLRVLGRHASIVPRVEALPLPPTLTRLEFTLLLP